MENRSKEDGNKDPGGHRFNLGNNRVALIFLLALVLIFGFVMFVNGSGSYSEIPYSTFLSYLEDGRIGNVKILDNEEIQGVITGIGSGSSLFKTRIPYFDDSLLILLRDKGITFEGASRPISPLTMIFQLLPWIVGFFLVWFMFRQVQGSGSRAFSFGKSRAKKYFSEGSTITFSDVAGQLEAKGELEEVVDFLKNPDKFVKIGARIPKGVLLVGMPGTGKTLMAKAIAGEAGVNFFHMSGSDFVEMFVGVGASRVRDLFEQGRKNSPCIIFIDELDAVGRTRGAGYGGGHDEREQTLNQMLVEMDGFDTKSGVIIVAATNRPDVLDPALLRPGRFDRQVVVDMPDVSEREAIIKIHCSKVKVDPDVNINTLARATPGSSGADLANLVNEAALFAARENMPTVSMKHMEEARDKLLLGVARRSKLITQEEKLATAYHEAGHALLHYHLENSDPLHKVTVVPHGRALGMAISLPEKDSYSRKKSWLLDRIKITMGGFVAEEIVYGETTTGTKQDIEQATDIARRMVREWGMSSELGFASYGSDDEPIFLGKEIATHKDYSESMAEKIDQAVHSILESCLNETRKLLKEHKVALDTLANALMERETLDDDQIRSLLNLSIA